MLKVIYLIKFTIIRQKILLLLLLFLLLHCDSENKHWLALESLRIKNISRNGKCLRFMLAISASKNVRVTRQHIVRRFRKKSQSNLFEIILKT
jgi:hypothetical protein